MPTSTTAAFPDGFLWGASTAAHQIEGNNTNSDHWHREWAEGTRIAEPSGDAADSYHRWSEDLDIVKGLGLNSYRFSLEWARIVPARGYVSKAELAHYRRMIEGCFERGITPVITLHHFTVPQWFAELGAWDDQANIKHFLDYVDAASSILHDVQWVATINEPNMLAMIAAMRKAGTTGSLTAGELPHPDNTVSESLISAHQQAVALLRTKIDAKLGWTVANQNIQPLPGGEAMAKEWTWMIEDRFIDAAKDDDWFGVQAYTRMRVDGNTVSAVPDEVEKTLTGWEWYPEAAALAVQHTIERLPGMPILITENGIATADDTKRIEYTRRSLQELQRVMNNGADIRGYLHWSLLDNYEWGSYKPTFGLVTVDHETFERTPKPSAHWLGSVARSAGVDLMQPLSN